MPRVRRRPPGSPPGQDRGRKPVTAMVNNVRANKGTGFFKSPVVDNKSHTTNFRNLILAPVGIGEGRKEDGRESETEYQCLIS